MDSTLVIITISLALASILNIVFTKFSISHIIGYIVTGVVVSIVYDFNGSEHLYSLDLIGEFGIVFLMFTIGLEMSYAKLDKLKSLIFINGFLQVAISSLVVFCIAYYGFSLGGTSSLIISLAFSLSSTAIVLPYLKKSKDIMKDKVSMSMAAAKTPSKKDNFSLMEYGGKFVAFLGLVLLLFYGLVTLMKKGFIKKGKLGFLNNAEQVSVLNQTFIGPKKSLMLVKAHNQVFLVSNTAVSYTHLTLPTTPYV